MNNSQLTCDRKRIQLLLDARLSDDEQSEFERHLDDCSECRDQLEATAARDEIWSGVREALPGQSMFLGLPRPDGQSSDGSMTDSATDRDAGFSQQAVLNLLAPTDDERMLGRLGTYEVAGVIAGTERVSHFEVGALKFSPDGTLLAVGTSIGQVKLFDVRTGEVVRSFDDEKAKLADEKTPASWKSLRRAMGGVVALAFSPDGRQLAMCGASFADFAVSFNSVRRLTRSVTGPGRVKVWDVGTGEMKYDLAGHDSHVNDVVFSPDGSMLASAGNWLTPDDWGTGVVLWSAHTGSKIRSFETSANGGTRSIAFSSDSRWLAIGTQRFDNSNSREPSSGGVSLVQVSSGTVAWLVTVPGWAGSVEFLADGKTLSVLCGGRSIRFLNTAAGKVQSEFRKSDLERGLWWDSAIAPQGDRLAIGVGGRDRTGSVEIRDLTVLKLSEDEAAATASEN